MKINKQSWHYRLVSHTSYHVPNTLCAYFWRVVWLVAVIFVAGSIIAICIASIAVFFAIAPLSLLGYEFDKESIEASIFTWVLLATVLVSAGIHSVYRRLVKRLAIHKYERQFKQPKEPGLLKSYINARKEKVCVTIEFE